MEELAEAELSPERGVEGDFRGRPGRRQLVLLAAEDWADALADLGEETSPWTVRRANLLVEGVELSRGPAARLRIGEALVELTGECDPCEVMDRQRPGLRAALEPDWRGGRTARVIEGGRLRVGDAVVEAEDA
ncbi:MAG: MOSC domain-containing protein [Geminicoccaceae bacterium]